MRKIIFSSGEYYHVYNRGVDRREVFCSPKNYDRFLLSMYLLNDRREGNMLSWRDFRKVNPFATLDDFLENRLRKREPLVEIVAYCLNPNHYHFILRQLEERGIEKFMHRLGTSYTKYFNSKNKRSGTLFQGVFKSTHIDSEEYLLYLSAYINANNFLHGYNALKKWPHSSLEHYLGKVKDLLVSGEGAILSRFKSAEEYEKFIQKNSIFIKEKKELVKYLLEEPSS